MNIVEFRKAILDIAIEADKILNDPADDQLLIVIDAHNDIDVLTLGFNDETFPKVKLDNSMTVTIVHLASELASYLEKEADGKQGEFREVLISSLDEIRELTDISNENVEDWEDTFREIERRSREIRESVDTQFFDESQALYELSEKLQGITREFQDSNGLSGLVFMADGTSRIEPDPYSKGPSSPTGDDFLQA